MLVIVFGFLASIGGWFLTANLWRKPGDLSPDDRGHRMVPAGTLAMTLGTLFLTGQWIAAERGWSEEQARWLLVPLMLLTVLSVVAALTVYFFAKPQVFVPPGIRSRSDRHTT
jgi:hypothetical protein